MSTIFAERPRFFEGQYLGADDLESFLKYAREHDARHMLGAHTWGIVAGIELVAGKSPTDEPEYLLAPGIAVDGYGRLLVVTAPFKLTTDLFAQQPTGSVDVWIRYEEAGFSGKRAGFQVCDCSDAYERVAESFTVEVGPRNSLDLRHGDVVVGDDTHTDAREAMGFYLPKQPLACDGSVPPQTFPQDEERALWLIPVGQVAWDKTAGAFLEPSEAQQKASRIFRRQAGLVAEDLYPAGGVLRLRPRWSARQAGVEADQVCKADAIEEADLATCGGELTFRELVWLEGHVRFRGDARLYGTRLEFQEAAGTDYLQNGVPLAIRRRPDRNEHNGFDLQVLLGERKGTDGPTRLTIGKASVASPAGGGQPDPCAVDFDLDAGVYVQEDAKVGIGTTDSLLALPLTIRAIGDTGNLAGFQAADGSLAWQVNLGPNKNGLNFTEADPATTRLFLEAGGNAGIGTLDPEAKLDIRGVPAPSGGNALGAGKWLQVGDGGDAGRVWLQYGDQSAPLMVMSDLDDPPRIRFQQVGTGTETGPEHASWIGHAGGDSSDLAVIDGNLGVATLEPFVALTVKGSLGFKSGSDPMIYIHESGTSNAERMVVAHSPDFDDWGLSYRDSGDLFVFLSGGTDVMAVDLTDGRVGIGTTNPAEALDVRGDIKLGASGNFFGLGCLDNLRMVAGRVSSGGARLSGAGFTVSRFGEGRYRVEYDPTDFDAVPVVVVTLVDADDQDNAVTLVGSSASQFEVHVRDVAPGDEGDYEDTAFNFIALGARP